MPTRRRTYITATVLSEYYEAIERIAREENKSKSRVIEELLGDSPRLKREIKKISP